MCFALDPHTHRFPSVHMCPKKYTWWHLRLHFQQSSREKGSWKRVAFASSGLRLHQAFHLLLSYQLWQVGGEQWRTMLGSRAVVSSCSASGLLNAHAMLKLLFHIEELLWSTAFLCREKTWHLNDNPWLLLIQDIFGWTLVLYQEERGLCGIGEI